MNTPSNVMAESPSAAIAPIDISLARRLYWLVARELWENRAVYFAPLIVAAVFLAGFLIGLVRLPDRMRAALALSPMQQHEAIQQPFLMVALILMFIEILVAIFYCLDGLYGERRDRSILFWKSLPVSDLETVLSKASIPILVLPLATFAVTVATQLVMLLMSSAVLASSGIDAALVWNHVPFIKTSLMNLVHLVGIHGLWYAPFYEWLLLVSAWAKRVPFLWATLPPLAIGIVEKMALNSSHFASLVRHRFMGGDSDVSTGLVTMDMLSPLPVGQVLTAPGLWLGLSVTALFLYLAVKLRRVRGLI